MTMDASFLPDPNRAAMENSGPGVAGSCGSLPPVTLTARHRSVLAGPGMLAVATQTGGHAAVADTTRHTPVADTVHHTPVADTVRHVPVADTVHHAPVADTVRHVPVADTVRHTPVADTVRHTPVADVFDVGAGAGLLAEPLVFGYSPFH